MPADAGRAGVDMTESCDHPRGQRERPLFRTRRRATLGRPDGRDQVVDMRKGKLRSRAERWLSGTSRLRAVTRAPEVTSAGRGAGSAFRPGHGPRTRRSNARSVVRHHWSRAQAVRPLRRSPPSIPLPATAGPSFGTAPAAIPDGRGPSDAVRGLRPRAVDRGLPAYVRPCSALSSTSPAAPDDLSDLVRPAAPPAPFVERVERSLRLAAISDRHRLFLRHASPSEPCWTRSSQRHPRPPDGGDAAWMIARSRRARSPWGRRCPTP